ncbi:hypothetical protein Acy02nite_83710 [Actinoplanes cyaneus]|uniref:Carrier domain-containing protein n=1 Tax=Actinoplanes cyaneus TaxID=52696 RepID=A0A919M5I4_9ACTN|nr:acyl carrier protein [Actinoplanes cyaneus]MCW2138215.1 acyl carrier protein [Actinoplanes cyaneus]GID70490.1 hypothetical protein Acy02nite_83710 [Actinoplanes cyaneus]
MTDSITATLIRLLAAMTGQDPGGMRPQTRLFLDLGLASGNALALIMELEDELGLGLHVDQVEWRHLETIGSLTDYLTAVAATGPQAARKDHRRPVS